MGNPICAVTDWKSLEAERMCGAELRMKLKKCFNMINTLKDFVKLLMSTKVDNPKFDRSRTKLLS